jgi:hypothetical protein
MPWADGLFPPKGIQRTYQRRAERTADRSFLVVSRSGRRSLALENMRYAGRPYIRNGLSPQNTISAQQITPTFRDNV